MIFQFVKKKPGHPTHFHTLDRFPYGLPGHDKTGQNARLEEGPPRNNSYSLVQGWKTALVTRHWKSKSSIACINPKQSATSWWQKQSCSSVAIIPWGALRTSWAFAELSCYELKERSATTASTHRINSQAVLQVPSPIQSSIRVANRRNYH